LASWIRRSWLVRMGIQAPSPDAGTYHCSRCLMLGKMNVVQVSAPSSRSPATTITKKMLLATTNAVPRHKLFRKSRFLQCLLTGIGTRGPENNNKTLRGLKQRNLKDLPEHQNSVIYNPLRKCVSAAALLECLHFRDSGQ